MRERKGKKYRKYISLGMLLGIVLSGMMLLYQAEYTFMSIMDSVVVGGILVFAFGWIIYVLDVGIFDLVTYGVKQFGLALINKRPKKSLDEHLYERTRVDKAIYRSLFISGGIVTLIGGILYLIYYL